MKTYTLETLPAHAIYLGSQHGDESIDESLADALGLALAPCRVREANGTFAYFDEALEVTK